MDNIPSVLFKLFLKASTICTELKKRSLVWVAKLKGSLILGLYTYWSDTQTHKHACARFLTIVSPKVLLMSKVW